MLQTSNDPNYSKKSKLATIQIIVTLQTSNDLNYSKESKLSTIQIIATIQTLATI